MEEFWNKDCERFSRKIWKPGNDFYQVEEKDPFWNCDHKDISFKKYLPNEEIKTDFDFKPVPETDNKQEKLKVYFTMFSAEIKRFIKKLTKNKLFKGDVKIYLDKLVTIKANADKIKNVTKKHKQFFIETIKKTKSFKKKFKKYKRNSKGFAEISQHFEQIDKIYAKMERLDNIVYCKKVKIFPVDDQISILEYWMYACIEIYNDLVEELNDIIDDIDEPIEEEQYNKILMKTLKNNEEFPINGFKMRNLKIDYFKEKYKDVPFCVIADTIMEFVSNVKGNLTKLGKGQIDHFRFGYRKHSRDNKVIPIQKKYTTIAGFYPSLISKIKTEENFKWKHIVSDYKVIYNKYHKSWYLHIPSYKHVKKITYERDPIAIMDPGMRAFQQLFGLDHFIAVGENMYNPIMKKVTKNESMTRKLKNPEIKLSKCSKRNIKRARKRTDDKIKDVTTELHNKLCLFLCKTYERVIVTDFSSRKVNGKDKNLRRNHKKVLGKLSHYRFRQRLSHKCKEYRCQYIEVTEEYTSKTCCTCGWINKTLDRKKVYKCDECGMIMDRDTNGAINIFIKSRSEVIN